jgi:hypothetical protein
MELRQFKASGIAAPEEQSEIYGISKTLIHQSKLKPCEVPISVIQGLSKNEPNKNQKVQNLILYQTQRIIRSTVQEGIVHC